VLGATLASGPSYAGSDVRDASLRPVLAGRLGRWTVSSSSARGLAGVELAGGISTTVVEHDRWNLGLGARITHGRSSADAAVLEGLPNISSSLALRLGVRYTPAAHWRLTAHAQQDALHAQGLRLNLGGGWNRAIGAGWVMDVNATVTWADARAMRTFYGVAAEHARAGRPAWQPGAGLEQWQWGVGLSRALGPHWRVSTSVARSHLLGQAADSPLTRQRNATLAQVSLAYVGW
jgi:outer membrane scaffolding protein for murein synthesis (MipA/OmpV family)